MKINKNELMHMINQIDDDLLNEAAEEYKTFNSSVWKRVIPVAACIALLVLGAAASVLKNITIDRSHEGIEGTAASENKGDNNDALNDSEKSNYIIQIDSEEKQSISFVLDLITDSFSEKGVSGNLVINSMELRILPENSIVSSGRIMLTDMDNLTELIISISQKKIIVDMEIKEDTASKEFQEIETELETEEATKMMKKVNWYDFQQAAKYVSDIEDIFQGSDYLLLSADLVNMPITDMENISDNVDILACYGDLQIIQNKNEIKADNYSYSFFIRISVVPDLSQHDILVFVK